MEFKRPDTTALHHRMQRDNPWWHSGQIASHFRQMQPRLFLPAFLRGVCESKPIRALVLMGPRRVGKTVMLHHAIQHLLTQGIPAHKIHYLALDTPIFGLLGLEELLHELVRAPGSQAPDLQGHYFFWDEIQYLDRWEVHLKSLVDSYPECKFVASGSAAATLRRRSLESGAGRFHDFHLPPLTFAEFLLLSGQTQLFEPAGTLLLRHDFAPIPAFSASDIQAANLAWEHYLNQGGYPEAAVEPNVQQDMRHYVQSDIVDKVLLRDLPSLYGIQDPQALNRLFGQLAFNTAHELNLERIGSQFEGLTKPTLRRYLDYLEAAFLTFPLERTDLQAKVYQRSNFFKLYLTNSSLYSAQFGYVDQQHPVFPRLTETGLINQFRYQGRSVFYARWKEGKTTAEIDLVEFGRNQKPKLALEIKWSDAWQGQSTWLRKFQEANPDLACILTSKTVRETMNLAGKGGKVQILPVAELAYTISQYRLAGNS